MGFLSDIANIFTGSKDADARTEAGQIQNQQAIAQSNNITAEGQRAERLYQPYQQLGETGVDLAGFLTDQNQQAEFLRGNPLFQLGLDNANNATNKFAASRGRLSAGDTYEQLNKNAMLVGQPLIQNQKQDILNLLGIGQNAINQQGNVIQNTSRSVADLMTGGSAAEAAGLVGAQNAKTAASGNALDAVMNIGGAIFSDPSLKTNKSIIGKQNGLDIWSWDWNDLAYEKLGLHGKATGHMADEVKELMPEAVSIVDGFMKVNYEMVNQYGN